jgi:hypothetical protein
MLKIWIIESNFYLYFIFIFIFLGGSIILKNYT